MSPVVAALVRAAIMATIRSSTVLLLFRPDPLPRVLAPSEGLGGVSLPNVLGYGSRPFWGYPYPSLRRRVLKHSHAAVASRRFNKAGIAPIEGAFPATVGYGVSDFLL